MLSLDRNIETETQNSYTILFLFIFLRTSKAAIAWVIHSSTAEYVVSILISVGVGVKIAHKNIDLLDYMIVSDYVIVSYSIRKTLQAKKAKILGLNDVDNHVVYF